MLFHETIVPFCKTFPAPSIFSDPGPEGIPLPASRQTPMPAQSDFGIVDGSLIHLWEVFVSDMLS